MKDILKNKIFKGLMFLFLLFCAILFFCYWQNNIITTTKISFSDSSIPASFDGYKILHISDLHNKQFGKNQKYLLSKVKKISPDAIFVTGDLIDANKINIPVAMQFIQQNVQIAPVYYVSGNHEAWSGVYPTLKQQLLENGVTILDNQRVSLSHQSDTIQLIGLSDPAFSSSQALTYGDNSEIASLLDILVGQSPNYTILLSHRPELFDVYADHSVNLVFAGHAHGGQFRIPFVGGLVAPDQGFFPKLTAGLHTTQNTNMIVSRGLGNSIIPLRLFNQPELVVVTLKK